MASRLNDKNNKKLQQKNEKILEEMSKMPGNNHCCDCGATGPRWASFNIGCFLCIKCGGIHRKMGTHISKVKSISLDAWTPEQIQSMQEWGNEKVNQHYLPNGETRKIPSDPIGMEQYIRDKYEHQVFRRGSGSRSSSTRNEVTDSPPSTFNAMHNRASNALVKLRDMGFTNVELNKRILSQTQMDVNAAIEILCNLPDEEPSQLKQHQAMGFDNAAKCGAALRKAGGDLDRAVELLVQDRELRKAQAERNGAPRSSRSHSKSSAPLPEPPRQAAKPKQDIFASAEDDQDDDFGDFQSTTAEPAASSKDYIMSLFESNPPQPTQTSVPQNTFNMGNSFGQSSQSNNPLDGLSFAPAPVNSQNNNNSFNNNSFNNGINNNQPFGGISLGFGGVSQPNQQQNIAQPLSFNSSQNFNNQQYSANSFNGNNGQSFNNNSSGFNQSFANNNTNQANAFSPPSYNQQSFQSQLPQHQQSNNNNNMHQLESSMQKLDPFGDLGSLSKKTYSTTSPPKASTPSFTSPTNASASANTPPKKVNVDDLLDLLS